MGFSMLVVGSTLSTRRLQTVQFRTVLYPLACLPAGLVQRGVESPVTSSRSVHNSMEISNSTFKCTCWPQACKINLLNFPNVDTEPGPTTEALRMEGKHMHVHCAEPNQTLLHLLHAAEPSMAGSDWLETLPEHLNPVSLRACCLDWSAGHDVVCQEAQAAGEDGQADVEEAYPPEN